MKKIRLIQPIDKAIIALFFKIMVFFALFYSFHLFRNVPNGMDVTYMKSIINLMLVSTIIFFIYYFNSAKTISWISILFLFSLSYIIVHFQLPILHSYGFKLNNKYLLKWAWGSKDIVNKSLLISTMGLLAFYAGYALLSGKKYSRNNNKMIKHKSVLYFNLLIYISYFLYILFFITSGSYKYGNYAAGDQMSISNYFFSGFNIFLSASILLKLYYIRERNYENISFLDYIKTIGYGITILTFWHIAFSFYVGDRAPIINYGLLYLGLYFVRWKRLNLIYLIGIIFILGTVFTILAKVRTNKNNKGYVERFNKVIQSDKRTKKFNNTKIPLSQTVELAFSVRCLNHVVKNIPSKYDYKYGYFQLNQIVAGLPWISKYFLKYIGNNEWKNGDSSNYITFLIQGDNAKYGDGKTPSADLYLDFGIYGVVIGLFMFGIFVKKADEIMIHNNSISLFFWIATMIYFASAFYLGRSSLLNYFQRIMQIYIILIVNNFLFSYLSIKNINET